MKGLGEEGMDKGWYHTLTECLEGIIRERMRGWNMLWKGMEGMGGGNMSSGE